MMREGWLAVTPVESTVDLSAHVRKETYRISLVDGGLHTSIPQLMVGTTSSEKLRPVRCKEGRLLFLVH
jgi:hypothetical protein